MVNEWPMVPIGDILDFKNGLNKGKEYFGHGTPIVNYTDVYHHSGLFASDIKGTVNLNRDEIKRFEVRKNDVFFTRTSETPEEVGLSAVMLEDIPDCAFSGFVLRGRPKNDILVPEYCKYCFSSKAIREKIISNCTYTTRALTNGRVLSAIKMPVPPKDEQRAIAATLMEMEIHITNLDKLIEKKKAIREGVLEDLVSGRTRLTGFTDDWVTMKISECGRFVSGNAFPLVYQGKKSGKYPFYKVSDLSAKGNENYMYSAKHYISQETAVQLSCNIIPANSIIFAKIGAALFLERKRMTTCESCIDNNMMAFLPNTVIASHFVWLIMQRITFGDYAQTTALPSLSGKSLGKAEFSAPTDIGEQYAIVGVLKAINNEIVALENERNKMVQIREGALDDLLTGRVRISM